MITTIRPGDIVQEDDLLRNIDDPAYAGWLRSIDVILLLGGGVPLSPTEPPVYVRRRCDVVARIMNHIRIHLNDSEPPSPSSSPPAVVCLSAGTAHVPQYITPDDGLPLWESTASAACLMRHPLHPVPEELVYAETTSYDTISNAYFARTTMTDVAGWRRILVVTNEFHVKRSRAIFDWIFGVPATEADAASSTAATTPGYEMYYLSADNVGLAEDALASRKSHEARGEGNVRTKLSREYATLRDVWRFLTEKHDFYSAGKLVRRATGEDDVGMKDRSDNLLKESYGRTSSFSSGHGTRRMVVGYEDGRIVLSLDAFSALALLLVVIGICLYVKNGRRHNHLHGSKKHHV